MDGRTFLTIFETVVLIFAIIMLTYASKNTNKKKIKTLQINEKEKIYIDTEVMALHTIKIDDNYYQCDIFLKSGNKISLKVRSDQLDNLIKTLFEESE